MYAYVSLSRAFLMILFLGFAIAYSSSATVAVAEDDDFVQVQIKGTLKTGVMAIGGETTGTLITAGNITWELDCSGSPEIKNALKRFDGKTVYVRGKLELKGGVEIRKRWIVHVDGLSTRNFFKTGEKKVSKSSALKEDGQLKNSMTLKLAQGGFAGFSGHLITIQADGTWQQQPFLNEKVREADAKGKLDKEQLAKLAGILAEFKVLSLPKELGAPVGANPSVTTIQFGEFQSQMTLPPGVTDPAKLKAEQENEKRLLNAISQIRKLLK